MRLGSQKRIKEFSVYSTIKGWGEFASSLSHAKTRIKNIIYKQIFHASLILFLF